MKLYLVRHGEARNKAEDPQRSLTERGREDVTAANEELRKQQSFLVNISHLLEV
jgi:phosphohistidine phosphatase SixA